MKTRLFLILIIYNCLLFAEPAIASFELPSRATFLYRSPTERFMDAHGYELILSALRNQGLSLEHRLFFESIKAHEELGFFGYHSSTQSFRVFQDIIRMILEEICQLEIRSDFHFLRVPGTPTLYRESVEQFFSDYPHINDNFPEQREQLVSINYTLFGNFYHFGECSIYYFTANRSAMSLHFQTKLEPLFLALGLSTQAIGSLFSIAGPLLESENAVLFQFFDFSHYDPFEAPYALVDQMTYSALPLGVKDSKQVELSTLFLKDEQERFPSQLRLLINNSCTLNPYGAQSIKRYDRHDPALIQAYEKALRQAIKKLTHDPVKAQNYRTYLLQLWGMEQDLDG